ncbi:MAG TPA: hypothetical protein VIL46_00605 [Gemmataceae bacterium]
MLGIRRRGWAWGLVGLVCVSLGHGQENEERPPTVAALMRQKLAQAQKVLDGVAVGDFDKIRANAEALIKTSRFDLWTVYRTEAYDVYTREFRRAAEDLVKASRAKNTEAAALGYVQLTLTCVRCHKYVRDEGVSRLAPPPAPTRAGAGG